jgi:hypothetical protein
VNTTVARLLESVDALANERCGKVDCLKNSSQKNRWLVTGIGFFENRTSIEKANGLLTPAAPKRIIQKDLKIKRCDPSKKNAV